MSWSKQEVSLLIEEYQKHTCLYNAKHVMYKNKHTRTQAMELITMSMQELRPGVTTHVIKTKLNGLRNTFFTERKKYLGSVKSGAGGDEVSLFDDGVIRGNTENLCTSCNLMK